MRYVVILLIFCAVSSSSLAQNYSKTIAWYQADSILPYMPLHKIHQDSLAQSKQELDRQLAAMKSERDRKAKSLAQDSAKMSPVILALKKMELHDLDSSYTAFKADAERDLGDRDSLYRQQEIAIIHQAALSVVKQKGFKEVHEHGEMTAVLDAAPTNVMTYNITELVMEEMKIRKK